MQAIPQVPDEPTMAGRVLELSTIDAAPSHTERGPRAQLRSMTGNAPVLPDLDVDSTRRLAEALNEIARRGEALQPRPR